MSQILTISNDLRTIDIPRDFVLGVESDDDVNRVYFSMPAAYGDTNLWPYKIRINYMNANGEGDMYTVPDEDKEILSDGIVDTISIPGAVEEIRKVTDARYSSSYTQDTCRLYYNRPEEIDTSGPSIWFDIDSDAIYTYRSGFGDQEWHNIEEKYVYDTTTGEWVGYPSANVSQLKTILRLLARNWTINENAMISYSEDMFLFVAKTEAAANSFLAQTGSAPYFLFAEYSKNNTLVTKLYQYVPKADGTAREWIEIADESTFGVPKNESGVPIYGDNYHIRFSWLVGRHACEIKGKVRFIVCLKLTDDQGVITNEFNTAVHEVPVLEGLETSEAIVQEREDIIEAILLRMDKIESIDIKGGYDKVIEVLDSIPEDYSELSQDVSDLKDDLDELADKTFSKQAKVALLSCLEHVFWKESDAKEYVSALRSALNVSNRRPELPEAYEQVEYIYGTGTQWTTFDFLSQIPFSVEAKVLYTRNDSNVFIGDSATIGANSNFRFLGYGSLGSGIGQDIGLRIGNNNWIYSHGYDLNTVYNVLTGVYKSGNNNIAYLQIDNNERVEVTLNNAPTVGYPMRLYKKDGDSWIGRGIYFYSLVCYGGGNQKIFDGIPCYRKSDNVSGFYDVVTNTFYSSEGTNNFLIGPIVE